MPTSPIRPAIPQGEAQIASEITALETPQGPAEIPRPLRVHVNRGLRLQDIEVVGFDMDYTLALYDQAQMEELSAVATLHKLVMNKHYPEAVRHLPYDARLAMRGLVIDLQEGNVFKPDRYGSPGRVVHGKKILHRTRVEELYHRASLRLSHERYAWIDSLFALPEAVLYVNLVDFFDHHSGEKPGYAQLWRDIRECIDLAHRDGSIKAVVAADLKTFIRPDEALAETLHRFRSSGKRLFVLTNSEWQYTNPVMSYLLDGVNPAYPSWRHFFDAVIVSAGKPGFFTEGRPFVEIGADGLPVPGGHDGPFARDKVYSGGNLRDFETRANAHGNEVLYVGDHIFGDMLRSRKSSAWQTAMVLQELEHEVLTHDRVEPELQQLDVLERHLRHLDAAIADTQRILRTMQKSDTGPGDLKKQLKAKLDVLREQLKSEMAEHQQLEFKLDAAFNPHWGPLFREGREISKFGEQVESYANVYTSRVSNFRFYSPSRHFRGHRDRMPHER